MRQFVWKRNELDVILMNGPGTCVPIVLTVYVQRVSVEEPLSRLTVFSDLLAPP